MNPMYKLRLPRVHVPPLPSIRLKNPIPFKFNLIFSKNQVKFSAALVALITTCLVVSLIAAPHMIVGPLQFQAPVSSINVPDFSPDVNLTGEAISVDPVSRTIVMNWYPILATDSCVTVDIFITTPLLDFKSPSWTSGPEDQAAIRLNGTEICLGPIQPYISFRTVTKLISSKNYLGVSKLVWGSAFENYPFDVYLAPFMFYSKNVETGIISPVRVSDSMGIAVNFKITIANSFIQFGQIRPNLTFSLLIERAMGTKIFVVLVAITNWLTALVFLIIVAAIIVYKPHRIYSEIFVVPVGSLFAFSSVRANLPGAPTGFGAKIDMYTILPVLVIMSLCSSTLLLIVLYRRIQEHATREQDFDLEANLCTGRCREGRNNQRRDSQEPVPTSYTCSVDHHDEVQEINIVLEGEKTPVPAKFQSGVHHR